MSPGFFVIDKHNWGYAKSLYEAIRNCEINAPARFTSTLDMIQRSFNNEVDLRNDLETMDEYPEDWQDEGEIEFQLVISNCKEWEFHDANVIDGTPSYNWIGEGVKPEGNVPVVVLSLTLDRGTGEMKLRKYEKEGE